MRQLATHTSFYGIYNSLSILQSQIIEQLYLQPSINFRLSGIGYILTMTTLFHSIYQLILNVQHSRMRKHTHTLANFPV